MHGPCSQGHNASIRQDSKVGERDKVSGAHTEHGLGAAIVDKRLQGPRTPQTLAASHLPKVAIVGMLVMGGTQGVAWQCGAQKAQTSHLVVQLLNAASDGNVFIPLLGAYGVNYVLQNQSDQARHTDGRQTMVTTTDSGMTGSLVWI